MWMPGQTGQSIMDSMGPVDPQCRTKVRGHYSLDYVATMPGLWKLPWIQTTFTNKKLLVVVSTWETKLELTLFWTRRDGLHFTPTPEGVFYEVELDSSWKASDHKLQPEVLFNHDLRSRCFRWLLDCIWFSLIPSIDKLMMVRGTCIYIYWRHRSDALWVKHCQATENVVFMVNSPVESCLSLPSGILSLSRFLSYLGPRATDWTAWL